MGPKKGIKKGELGKPTLNRLEKSEKNGRCKEYWWKNSRVWSELLEH